MLLVIALAAGFLTIKNRTQENRGQKIAEAVESGMKGNIKPEITIEKEETLPDPESIPLYADAACIYRVDGEGRGTLLYDKNAEEKRAQASTTKLLTAMLLIDSGKLEDDTVISENAASTSEIYYELEAGDVYSNHDLMYAMMLPSANDAAVAIAEGVSGDTQTFVSQMNDRAAELGLNDTHYVNPHGLDADDHYSTALDIAKLTAYAYEYPDIRESWTYKTKTITGEKTGNAWTLESTDLILGYDDNFKGGKTGTQPVAGFCFAGVYEYNGKTFVTVVLDCDEEEERWADTKALHQYIREHEDDIKAES